MLDKWFMKHLSKKGILWYWAGQIIFFVLLAVLIFGVMGLGSDEGLGYLMGGGLVFIIGWGFTCKALWPKLEGDPLSPSSPIKPL